MKFIPFTTAMTCIPFENVINDEDIVIKHLIHLINNISSLSPIADGFAYILKDQKNIFFEDHLEALWGGICPLLVLNVISLRNPKDSFHKLIADQSLRWVSVLLTLHWLTFYWAFIKNLFKEFVLMVLTI